MKLFLCEPYVREHTTFARLNRAGQAALVVPLFAMETVHAETWVEEVVLFRQYAGSVANQQSANSRGASAEAVAAAKIAQMGHQAGRIGSDEKYTPVQV